MSKPARVLWLPAAVMLLIFLFSSQSYEQQTIKKPLADWLGSGSISRHLSGLTIHYGSQTVDGKTEGSAAVAEFLLRKCAHLLEYAILGFCLIWAIRTFLKPGLPKAAAAAVFASAGYASLDEFHQLFVKDRGPHPEDVLLDTTGALIGLLCYIGWEKLKARRMKAGSGGDRRTL
ncbi:hypothetical protein AWM70_00790 [Paenibacillus yonginensis]|uniref:VanZ-like domain-containing protein n=1 Tax=Paenibacillus yonginensis TaxID=1462996 RepID=A0A1B1MVX9_9BACL|nr:VanZ family protein [Paenibacillus yonginensis]ANS73297.1 hypothetical protein AWM70_00790 [Paenibacillus yonginensis]